MLPERFGLRGYLWWYFIAVFLRHPRRVFDGEVLALWLTGSEGCDHGWVMFVRP
ncbi:MULTISPECIES: hypothetical protein [Streptomyces]|uniref:hypothetical protein n=1 Tax=Streptomyces TaxID=1883 RepID=UPI000A6D30BC|nr:MULTISPECIES: hypothetical protein [Streptomyces]